MRKTVLHILVLAVLTSKAHSQLLIHASATIGSTNQTMGGGLISSEQFLGTRFKLASSTHISGIGGHFYSLPGSNGEMFGAIMRLGSLTSLPTGDPFNSADLSRIMLSTVVTVSRSSSVDYKFPVSATLEPGFYALIFGKGQFGSSWSGGVAAAEGSQNLSPDYMMWNDESTTGWGNGGFPRVRLTVYGAPVSEPGASSLSIVRSGTLVTLSWPVAAPNFHLQESTNLAMPNAWLPVAQSPVTNGAQISLTVPATGAGKFFRLKSP